MLAANRQVAHALAGRVIDGIGDRRCDPDHCNLSEAFHARAVELRIRLVDELDLDRADVGVHRNDILGEIGIQKTAIARVDFAYLPQRRADAPHDPASYLTRSGSGTHDTAAIDHA